MLGTCPGPVKRKSALAVNFQESRQRCRIKVPCLEAQYHLWIHQTNYETGTEYLLSEESG